MFRLVKELECRIFVLYLSSLIFCVCLLPNLALASAISECDFEATVDKVKVQPTLKSSGKIIVSIGLKGQICLGVDFGPRKGFSILTKEIEVTWKSSSKYKKVKSGQQIKLVLQTGSSMGESGPVQFSSYEIIDIVAP